MQDQKRSSTLIQLNAPFPLNPNFYLNSNDYSTVNLPLNRTTQRITGFISVPRNFYFPFVFSLTLLNYTLP